MRSLPWASAAVMAAPDMPGLATKNFDSGTDVPAAVPLAHDGPEEFCRTAGTNTL